ncbi:co-regulatory protein PtrA N-terminal domain-containing protein [Pseudomonas sp. MWU13-2105]|uniref:co-regulatory protein PtrA N-terminal domain-containing protein n=1 Tax=Pseudomonas sp. MWU13-2105 TaxID=2935074 RepID=UPI00200C38EE|nr:co-regulatory protein PtrA N-terminal domain-containing protein [Pseudomonas sp. MWU13-2105]
MKSLKALLIVTLMTASVAAMAEGGSDKVVARMEAARDVSMAHYQQSEKAQAVAAGKQAGADSVDRTN